MSWRIFDMHQFIIPKIIIILALILAVVIAVTPAQSEPVDFSLPDLKGEQHKLSEFRGKWVLVNYWATWCPPCLDEIPELVEFHEAHKDKNAVVIGVNFEEIGMEKLKSFVDDYFMSYPILQMKPGPTSDLGFIEGLPTSFLVSPKGELLAKQTGPVSAKMIEDFISEQEKQQN